MDYLQFVQMVALLELCQAGFKFNGFGFDLGPCDGHGGTPVLGRLFVRYVFGLVGREQGKSARGRRYESKKIHIVMAQLSKK